MTRQILTETVRPLNIHDLPDISVILPVHNQETIIGNVVKGIYRNKSSLVKEIIIILDGCTDGTAKAISAAIPKGDIIPRCFVAHNVNEVIANNMGLQESRCGYSILVQDDMVITEPSFDNTLFVPFCFFKNLLAVSGRDAADVREGKDGKAEFYNLIGRDGSPDRNIFGVRDIVNRGPLLVDNAKMKELNYFNEDFAPISQDDTDLCLRAWAYKQWIVGSYIINYVSDLSWGTTRKNPKSSRIMAESEELHLREIVKRHKYVFDTKKYSYNYKIPRV